MAGFFERKMTTLFKRFDIDDSGSITEADFETWSNSLISFGKKINK